MKKIVIIICLVVAGVAAYTQSDTVILKEVVINSARTNISESQMLLPLQILDKNTMLFVKDVYISSVLKDYSAVDIRQRSFSSVQSERLNF